MAITWVDNICSFVVEDDVPDGKIKRDKLLADINAATVNTDALAVNTEEIVGEGKTRADVVFEAVPDATDKTATESVITNSVYTPKRPWASARRIMHDVFLASSGQVQTDRILKSIDARPSWVLALDAGNYSDTLTILSKEIGKSLEQEDYDLIESYFPDPV